MKTYLIEKKGTFEKKQVERDEILKMFHVHTRDLRPILSQKQVATILRRDKAIVVNIHDIKIILNKSKALLFCASETKEEKIVDFFTKKMEAYVGIMPFELYLIDKAFYFMFKKVNEKFETLFKQSQQTIKKLSEKPTDEYLEKLLSLKKRIGKIDSQMNEFEGLLSEFLEEENVDELSFKKSPTEKEQNEIESVIENLFEQAEQINHAINELSENVDDSQEILSLKIANKRNTIIRLDLIISFVAATFGFLAVITGLYGMNLKNNLESDDKAFMFVLAGMGFTFFVAVIAMVGYFRKNKIL